MARMRLRSLAAIAISFYILLSLSFHSHITKLSLSFAVDTNTIRTRHTGRTVNTTENTTVSFGNNATLLSVNKVTGNDSGNISRPEVPFFKRPTINFTLPKFNKRRPIVFLHIGKNGGTSFDAAVKPIVGKLHGRYIGNRHFDWSYIETLRDADAVVLLREPVARAVSHFYFMRKWSRGKLNQIPLLSFLNDPQKMLASRDFWQDGQAAVSWLTGTHVASWVGISKDKVPSRERMSLNISEICALAAKRLESTFWFGIIEDPGRSFELLQHQLGWSRTIHIRKSNANKHTEATGTETRILASLMPQDIWLYEYAKLLFEARWTHYKSGVYRQPDTPPLPTLEDVPCVSTRFILLCKKGPLSPLYYVDQNAPVHDQRLPDNVMNTLRLDENFFHSNNLSLARNIRNGPVHERS